MDSPFLFTLNYFDHFQSIPLSIQNVTHLMKIPFDYLAKTVQGLMAIR